MSTHIYRLRLEWIFEHMISLDYAKENSEGFVRYLGPIRQIVGYLRSIKEPSMSEQRLLEVVHRVMKHHEQKLRNTLFHLNFEILDTSILPILEIDASEPSSRTEGVSI